MHDTVLLYDDTYPSSLRCTQLGVTCSSGYGGGVGICVNSACTLSELDPPFVAAHAVSCLWITDKCSHRTGCPGGTTLSSRNGALACLATARRRY